MEIIPTRGRLFPPSSSFGRQADIMGRQQCSPCLLRKICRMRCWYNTLTMSLMLFFSPKLFFYFKNIIKRESNIKSIFFALLIEFLPIHKKQIMVLGKIALRWSRCFMRILKIILDDVLLKLKCNIESSSYIYLYIAWGKFILVTFVWYCRKFKDKWIFVTCLPFRFVVLALCFKYIFIARFNWIIYLIILRFPVILLKLKKDIIWLQKLYCSYNLK